MSRISTKQWTVFAIVVIVVVACICVISTIYLTKRTSNNKMVLHGDSYFRLKDNLSNMNGENNSLEIIELIKNAFGSRNIHMAKSYKDASIYFFETLNTVDQLIKKVNYGPNCRYIFGIAGTDNIASKAMLAMHLKAKYGDDAPIPTTYVYSDKNDMDMLRKKLASDDGLSDAYILKKDQQKQTGLLITRDQTIILNGQQEGYVVAQRLLANPLIVGNRKTNFRIYMLIIVKKGKASFWIFNNGFLYYSAKLWTDDSNTNNIDQQIHITTGHVDRAIYEENPLTLLDLREHLTPPVYDPMWENILGLFMKIRATFAPILEKASMGLPGTQFTLMGCDVAADAQGRVLIMEGNKGPEIQIRSPLDGELKQNMVSAMISLAIDNTNLKVTNAKKRQTYFEEIHDYTKVT